MCKDLDIIIIVQSPFSRRDYDRFGIEILKERYNVQVLDCTPWLKHHFWELYSGIAYVFPGYTPIYDLDGFKSVIYGIVKGVCVDHLGNCPISQHIRQELQDRSIPRIVVDNGPIPEITMNLFGKIQYSYKQGTLAQVMLNKLRRTFHFVKVPSHPSDIAILSGKNGLNNPRMQAMQQIWAHSFDYDLYLKYRDRLCERFESYAVFLDEDIVHSYDYEHNGLNPTATEDNYYRGLNALFDKFEANTGLRVIISAHPSSHYDLQPNLLNGREFVVGRTAELVRDAQLIFCHASTSISFAVLWRKPMVFITSDELKRSWWGPHIALRSEIFHAPLVNMDCRDELTIDLKAWLRIDDFSYADYKEKYIKRAGTPELPLWQIFSDYIDKNLK